MKKSFLRYLIMTAAVAAAILACAGAMGEVSGTAGEHITWSLENGVLTFDGYGAMEDFSPSHPAPWGTDITEVWFNFPSEITRIGDYAFYGCSSLTYVPLYFERLTIGSAAFQGCTGLISITIPDGASAIGSNAFRGCTGLTEVKIGKGLLTISANTFRGCSNLATVTIPGTVTGIGSYAFYQCGSLTDVCFMGITAQWDAITIASGNSVLTDEVVHCLPTRGTCGEYGGDNLTWALEDGVLTISGTGSMENYWVEWFMGFSSEGDSPEPIFCNYPFHTLIIEEGVTSIGSLAFANCTGLTNVTIPSTVTSIGTGAFRGCTGLADANGFIVLNGILFHYAGGASAAVIPSGVTRIDCSAFAYSEVESVVIPEGVTELEWFTFAYCENLHSITLPLSLTKIPEEVFLNLDQDIPYGESLDVWYAGTIMDWEWMDVLFSDWEIGYEPAIHYGTVACDPADLTVGEETDTPVLARHEAAYFRFEPDESGDYLFSFAGGDSRIAWLYTDDYSFTEYSYGTEISAALTAGQRYYLAVGNTGSTADSFHVSLAESSIHWSLVNGVLTVGGTGELFVNPWSDRRDEIVKIMVEEGITRIGNNVFNSCHNLTEIVIPDTCVSIGSAFRSCTSLTSFTIPRRTGGISPYAFEGCTALRQFQVADGNNDYVQIDGVLYSTGFGSTGRRELVRYPQGKAGTTYTIPDGTVAIRDNAFNGSQLSEILIPDSVTNIGDYAFSKCENLTGIVIPSNVRAIRDGTFYHCTNLSSVSLPEHLTSIGIEAFYDCWDLTDITIPARVTRIGYSAFAECYDLTDIEIPIGVSRIEGSTFYYCNGLRSITIPSSVTYIGSYAFYECDRLSDIYYGGSEEQWDTIEVGDHNVYYSSYSQGPILYQQMHYVLNREIVHFNCGDQTLTGTCGAQGDNLTWALTDGVLTISGTGDMCDYWRGDNASASYHYGSVYIYMEPEEDCDLPFFWEYAIHTLVIEEGVTSIGHFAFVDCTGLTSVALPSTVTKIGYAAFSNCPGLADANGFTIVNNILFGCFGSATDIVIPSGVKRIDPTAFAFSSVTSVVIPYGVTFIDYDTFCECDDLVSVTIPDSVTYIDECAFVACDSLPSISIPGSIASISYNTFGGCTGLTTVTLQNGVVSIGEEAFYGCSSLTEISIPVTVTEIGRGAFCDCESLIDVWYGGTQEQWNAITISIQNDCLTGANIHFTDTGSYCGAEGDGSNLTWSLEDGVLTIRGTGAMADYTTVTENGIQLTTAPWGTEITRLIAEDGVTHIGSSAFAGCTALTEVTLADSVTGFGSNAFRSCTGLTSFTVPDGVTALSQHLFRGCTALTDITIPNSITGVAAYAFTGCSALTDVWYSGTRTQWDAITIGSNNGKLTGANIHCIVDSGTCGAQGNNLTWVLEDGGRLVISGTGEMMDFGSSFWSREGYIAATPYEEPFFCDYAIRSVVIEDGVTTIGDCAFASCSLLTQISIPDSVVSIGFRAFADTALASVTVPDSVEWIRDLAFVNCGSLAQLSIADDVRIGDGAFKGCSALADAQGFVVVRGRLYDYAYGPTTVTIPNTVTSIDPYTFIWHGEPRVTEIVIPDTVSRIESYTFWIGEYTSVFDFVDLRLIVPTSVIRIDACVFDWFLNCTIDYAGSPLDWMRVNCYDERMWDPETPPIPVNYGHDHTDAPALTVGETVPVTLMPLGSAWFSFVPAETAVYSLVTAGETGTLACMHDADYGEIVEGDRTEEKGNSRITVQLTAGETYYFGVGLDGDAAGSTTVTLLKDSIAWTLENGTLTITGSGELFIHPWNEYVGFWTMSDTRLEITRVIISEGVTSIGDYVFMGCSNMTSITIPATVTCIGESAFNGCSALTAVTLPEGVTRIAEFAFADCTGLTEMTIPASVTAIGSSAFVGCTGIMRFSVRYANPVYYEYGWGIYNKELTELLHFPAGRSGTFSMENRIRKIGAYAFDSSALSGITIGIGVSVIDSRAFADCHNLTQIILPARVTEIGEAAFWNSGLTSIAIPGGLTSIENSVFAGCVSLTSVSIPISVTEIGSGTFDGCDGLGTVYYGGSEDEWYEIDVGSRNDPLFEAEIVFDHVDAVASGTCGLYGDNLTWTLDRNGTLIVSGSGPMAEFGALPTAVEEPWAAYRTQITSVVLKEGVTTIGHGALTGCYYLKTVAIPASLERIGADAFASCGRLSGIMVSSGNSAYTSIDGVLFSADGYDLIKYPPEKTGASYIIPDGTMAVCSYAFGNCQNLVTITIPNSVAAIGAHAFEASGIVSIEIPDSVTSLGEYAFMNCWSLASAALQPSLMSIPNGLFYGCNLLTMFAVPDNVTVIGEEAFRSCYGMTAVTIPAGVLNVGDRAFLFCSQLKNVYYGGTYESWRAMEVGEENISLLSAVLNCDGTVYRVCGDNLFWSLDDDGVLTISGTGPMYSYDSVEKSMITPREYEPLVTSAPWGWKITGLIVENGVTSIGASAFLDCQDLAWVSLPPSLVSIGEYAFEHCGFTEITLPDSLVSIGWSAFSWSGLTEVTIPAGVTAIGEFAFSNNYSLETVTLAEGVTSIGQDAFSYCENLKSVHLPDTLTVIGWDAFARCLNLRSIRIPDTVTEIGRQAFVSCRSLTEIIIPERVTNIMEGAFESCASLTDVYYPGTEAQWNQITIGSRNGPLTQAVMHFGHTGGEFVAGGTWGDNMLWRLDAGGTMTITGTGMIDGFMTTEFGSIRETPVTALILENGVTGINDEKFWGWEDLTTLTLPGSLTAIGNAAFCECRNLSAILIPDGVPTQQKLVCYRGQLYDLVLPAGIEEMGSGVFQNTGLNRVVTAVTLPDDLTTVEAEAFADTPITGVSITSEMNGLSIGNRAFAGCTQLRVAIFCVLGPIEVSPDAFEGCNSLILAGNWELESVADEHGFEYIPDTGFYGN